ncbi:MAG: carboxylesterase [Gallionellaceae bacterium]
MPTILPHITLDTAANPQHSIIWLHGLGADGQDFVPIAEEMSLPVAVRYIFPHAPKQPVTINAGFIMRSWYDIVATDMGRQQDTAGIKASQAEIQKLIVQERERGVLAENIFLAGFSQGGAVALHTGLRHTEKLGGILALSTYLPVAELLEEEASSANKHTAIFIAHGCNDPIVPFKLGKHSSELLIQQGYQIDWHEYAMPHSVCQDEVHDIEGWLCQRLKR